MCLRMCCDCIKGVCLEVHSFKFACLIEYMEKTISVRYRSSVHCWDLACTVWQPFYKCPSRCPESVWPQFGHTHSPVRCLTLLGCHCKCICRSSSHMCWTQGLIMLAMELSGAIACKHMGMSGPWDCAAVLWHREVQHQTKARTFVGMQTKDATTHQ